MCGFGGCGNDSFIWVILLLCLCGNNNNSRQIIRQWPQHLCNSRFAASTCPGAMGLPCFGSLPAAPGHSLFNQTIDSR